MVGFGGYPTLPPLLAARLFGMPGIIHEANAVLGRANRFLSSRVSAIATSLPGVLDRDPALAGKDNHRRHADASGDPRRRRGEVRFARAERSAAPAGGRRQPGRAGDGRYRAAGAIERLEPALWSRLVLTQQVREEDMARVRAVYDRLKINAELAPFFTDLPARLASSHLVVSRSGAGTVAELGAIGRPSILVPLPGSIDQDQFANAGVLAQAGGAIRIRADRIHAGPAGGGNLRARRRAGAADRDGRKRPHRRQARCRRAAGRSGGESRRNLGQIAGFRIFCASWPGLSRPSTSCMN